MAWTNHANNDNNGSNNSYITDGSNASASASASASQAGTSNTGATTATAIATAIATPDPAASRNHTAVNGDGYARPVFKNPLGMWRSPSPPPKRQKTMMTTSQTLPLPPPPTTPPLVFSRSQPAPVTNGASSPVPTATPRRPGARPLPPQTPRSLLPALRQNLVPTGFKKALENNRVVLVIDDDDDDNVVPPKPQPSPLHTPVTPAPAPVLPPAAAPAPIGVAASPATRPLHPSVNGDHHPGHPGHTGHLGQPAALASTPRHFPQLQGQVLPQHGQQLPPSRPQQGQQLPPSRPQQPLQRLEPSMAAAWTVAPPLFTKHDTQLLRAQPTIYSNVKAPSVEDGSVGDNRSLAQTKPLASIEPPVTAATPISTQVRTKEAPASSSHSERPEAAAAVEISPSAANTSPMKRKQKQRQQRQQLQENFVRFSTLTRRPYLCSEHREFVSQHFHGPLNRLWLRHGLPSAVIHVDFLPDEVQHLLDVVRAALVNKSSTSSAKARVQKHSSLERELKSLLHGKPLDFGRLVVSSISQNRLPGREPSDIYAFLADVCSSSKHRGRTIKSSTGPAALIMKRHDRAAYYALEAQAARAAKLSTFLMMREAAGHRTVAGRTRQLFNFTNELRKLREDGLRIRNEWTNCAGDVITISWTSDDAFICGTTTHMDDRNHQYNRQGNLALASVGSGTLRAYPDHRIDRSEARRRNPADRNNNGSQESMLPRTSSYDDSWLYTSVVSSDYDATHDLAFTSGFDRTVRLWRASKDGNAMTPMGTWRHEGKVNFVVASSDPVGLIATAADVPVNAVRIYRLPGPQSPGRITYKMLSCSRIVDLEGRPVLTNKWAYFPAAIRWGLTEATRSLLLVGYSPRGLGITTEDDDIPEDRRNSGELCLWNGRTGDRWRIMGGTSQNVFEVAWHPTQSCFAAATAPNVHSVEDNVRTQIRIFRPSANKEYGGRAYSEVQTLDCFADDINELALLPNSIGFLYVAAGCTNGHTYVWDTSQGDNPIHDLGHGECIEEMSGERISVEDTGVKFVAWGETPDRLYTGSSDGVVKVWNVRTHGTSAAGPFVRNLLHCPASVSFGVFSPNKSKLAVGDASGRVFLLSVEDGIENNDEDGDFLSEDDEIDPVDDKKKVVEGVDPRPNGPGHSNGLLRSSHRTFKHHPPEIIRHATPPPLRQVLPVQAPSPGPAANAGMVNIAAATADDDGDDNDSGLARARAFLSSGQLVVAPDPTIGAVKGPNYADTELFCLDFHQDRRPENPLLAQFDRQQQENRPRASTLPSWQRALRSVFPGKNPSVQILHQSNIARDLDVDSLPAETRQELELADRAALLHLGDNDYDYGFAYEEVPADL